MSWTVCHKITPYLHASPTLLRLPLKNRVKWIIIIIINTNITMIFLFLVTTTIIYCLLIGL